MDNLANDSAYFSIKAGLWERLAGTLIEQNDPRMTGDGDFFDSCPVFKPMPLKDENGASLFPGFAEYGEYNHGFHDGGK
jgi:hypothetical protein